ncbi:MAG: TonB-dependent receptor [Pseudomonadota bacterium]
MEVAKNIASSRTLLFLALTGVTLGSQAQSTRQRATSLEEVVVTAQKREESKQDVGISVSALDAKAIERTFARDIQEIESLSPNLIIDPIFAINTAAISIRGMQLNDGEKSFDPAVAVYLDGVYLATTTGALLHLWDAKSVEVLRGPQGTLFGRNTIGGLVHIQRADPTGEWGGRVAYTHGSFDQNDYKATLNFPAILDDTLATKLSVIRKDGGSFFENEARGGTDGHLDFWGVTATALWQPSDSVDARLIYEWNEDDTDSLPITGLAVDGDVLASIPGGLGRRPEDTGYHRNSRVLAQNPGNLETNALTFTGRYALDEVHQVETIVGWRQSDEFVRTDFDAVTPEAFWVFRPQELEQTSVEVRWHMNTDRMQTVLGAFWWDSEYSLRQRNVSPLFFGTEDFEARPFFDQKTESYAVFGQLDYNLTDKLTLTVGGRWLEEEKTACGASQLVAGGQILPGATAFGQPGFGVCGDPDFELQTEFVDVNGELQPIRGSETWSEFTPRVALTYEIPQGIVYASFSEGFRSGGYNGRSSNGVTFGPYDPEKVESYELGIKTDWFENRLRFNATVFFTDYQDKQEDVVFPDPNLVTVTLVQNAASASINGLELELSAVPVDGLTLSGNFGYLDAEFDEWTVPGLNGQPVDKSGFELRRAPEFTAALNAVYEYPLANGDFLVFTGNYAWKDDYFVNANSITTHNEIWDRPVGRNDAFGLLDLSINYESDNWRASVFGKNVTGEDYFLHVLDVGYNFNGGPGGEPLPLSGLWTYGTINPPPIYGIELQYSF